jgi:tetratricopeptide (TPR) repeat protein
MTELKVNRALDEAAMFQAQAKWPEALEAAKRADGILAAGGSEELGRRVRELREDVEMVLRLEELWMPREAFGPSGCLFSPRRAIAYATAFRDYGIDVEALEPSEAAARIRARKIRLELAMALDLWALFLRDPNRAPDATERRLLAVARAADPDEWRHPMRTALEQRDDKALKKLLASAQVSDLPVQTLSLVVFIPARDPQVVLSLLRRAQQAHPDHFLINFQLAWTLQNARPGEQQLGDAIRFYTAALALRPRNAHTWFWLAQALKECGRVDEQIACDRQAIALDPDYLTPYFNLSSGLEAQGRHDEATAVLRKAAARSSDDPQDLNNLAWTLATSHHFSELRDVPRAVALVQKAVELAPEVWDYWNTLGVALYRAGSWKAGIAALEKSMALRGGGDSMDWFFLAMAHWQLGERDEARQWYDRAVRWMGENHSAYDDELRRFRAEAAELLGLTPSADRKREHAPAHQASQAEHVPPADPSAARARAWLGQSGKGPNHRSCPPADAAMPNGPVALAQP